MPKRQLNDREQRELERLRQRLVRQQTEIERVEAAQNRRRDARTLIIERMIELGEEREEISELSRDGGRLEGLSKPGIDAARKRYKRRQLEAVDGDGAPEPALKTG